MPNNSKKRKITHHYDLRSKNPRHYIEPSCDQTVDEFIRFFTRKDPHKKNFLYQYNTRHKIEVIHAECHQHEDLVKKAILLLKNKAPKYYALFCLYNKKVCIGSKFTCANIANDSIDFASEDLENCTHEWAASALIHETVHHWQYAAGMFASKSKQQIELEALKYDLESLILVGGQEYEIKHLQRQRGTHYSQPGYQ